VAATTTAQVGDSVKYTIQASNPGTVTLANATIHDNLPQGFRYIAGTAMVNGARIPDPAGGAGPALVFALPALNAGQVVQLTYFLRVGVGAQQGNGINTAQLYVGNTPRSNVAAAKVRVTGGVLGDDACIAGKVFVDCNGDGIQDNTGGSNELGIPGVRILMESGAWAVTDAEGKYNICPVSSQLHVVQIDPRTAPKGARWLPTSNRNAGVGSSLFADVQNGELFRADFMEGSCSADILDQVKKRRALGDRGPEMPLAPVQSGAGPHPDASPPQGAVP